MRTDKKIIAFLIILVFILMCINICFGSTSELFLLTGTEQQAIDSLSAKTELQITNGINYNPDPPIINPAWFIAPIIIMGCTVIGVCLFYSFLFAR